MNGHFQPSDAVILAAIVILFALSGTVILSGLVMVLR